MWLLGEGDPFLLLRFWGMNEDNFIFEWYFNKTESFSVFLFVVFFPCHNFSMKKEVTLPRWK